MDPAEWGEADLLAMYHEAHPPGADAPEEARISAQQRRERIALLRMRESKDSEAALPEHSVDGWFDELTAQRLRDAGVRTLGELQLRIAKSQRWYRRDRAGQGCGDRRLRRRAEAAGAS